MIKKNKLREFLEKNEKNKKSCFSKIKKQMKNIQIELIMKIRTQMIIMNSKISITFQKKYLKVVKSLFNTDILIVKCVDAQA